MADYTFETLNIQILKEGIAHVELCRPKALNAFSYQMWNDIGACFTRFKTDSDVRCVVLSGSGRYFTSGLDLKDAIKNNDVGAKGADVDVARKGYYHRLFIMSWQQYISAIESCDKPVIAVIHNGCIGAGIDLVTACDIRFATSDAFFTVKEVDIGMAPDVGTLQRLQKVVGNDSWVREVCYSTRKFDAKEAQSVGLVSRVCLSKDEAMVAALELAHEIASKSPVAVTSTKHLLNHARDHSVQEGLEYTALWNTLMHNSKDMGLAMEASLLKKKSAHFPKL